MNKRRWLLTLAAAAAAWIALRWVNSGGCPATLGVAKGRLHDCPDRPNCVSSQAARDDQKMEALALEQSPADALRRIQDAIRSMPRARIVSTGERYVHAEFRSLLLGFVDDVEFHIDAEDGRIHFRSASRMGYSDLGVNRRRMQELQRRLAADSAVDEQSTADVEQ